MKGMSASSVPKTSQRLLAEIGANAKSPRWAEFVARYRPMMERFLATRFPPLAGEADDIVQETLVALMTALPHYQYVPDENGAFHNYLTGILCKKAIAALRGMAAERRRIDASQDAAEGAPDPGPSPAEDAEGLDEEAWRNAVFEIALKQLLADESIRESTKQVFVRIAVKGEKPADVARDFGIDRNVADQMKSRMTRKLRETVAALGGAAVP